MRLNRFIYNYLLFLWLGVSGLIWGIAYGQTQVQLRDNPSGGQIFSPGCTNTTPIVCTITPRPPVDITGLIVAISRVPVVNSGANNISAANGFRKVGAVSGIGADCTAPITCERISLLDPTTNNPIAGNGAWSDGRGANNAGGAQLWGVVNPYNLVTGLKSYFDGTSGTLSRSHAQTSQNGLASTNGVQVVVTGSNCVLNITMSTPLLPVMVGNRDHFLVRGTANTAWEAFYDGVSHDFTVAASPAPTSTTYSSTSFSCPSGITVTTDLTHSNDHCGVAGTPTEVINGTDPCVIVSVWAVTTNPNYAAVKQDVDSLGLTGPKFFVDGGTAYNANSVPTVELAAELFLVDRVNHGVGSSGNPYSELGLYYLNKVELIFGANFMINESYPDGANGSNSYGHDNTGQSYATIFTVFQSFLTPAHNAAFLGKWLNDVQDASPCTKNLMSPHDTLVTGVLQAASSTTATLASSDTQPDGFYINNVLLATRVSDGRNTALTITGYTSSTKVAVGTWNPYTPSAGDSYAIYSTVTISTAAQGATAVITGYNTNFSDLNPGDMVQALDNYYIPGSGPQISGWSYGANGSWVTSSSVISPPSGSPGTTQTITNVINSGQPQLSTSVPQVYWRNAKWTTGNCGWIWMAKHFDGNAGNAQPASYGLNGGAVISPALMPSNNLVGHNVPLMQLLLVLADYDARAVLQLAQYHLAIQDLGLAAQWNYTTGLDTSGVGYGLSVTTHFAGAAAWLLNKNVVGFPDVGLTSDWTLGVTKWKLFSFLPDNPWTPNGRVWSPIIYGGAQSNNLGTIPAGSDLQNDFGMAANPTDLSSQYLKNLLLSRGYNNPSTIGGVNLQEFYVRTDPRIVSTPYTNQPLQYFFGNTANGPCVALTWWNCDPKISAFAVLSRGWGTSSTAAAAWNDPMASLTQYQARSFMTDHDSPQMGGLQIMNTGALRASDELPVGDSGGGPPDIIDSMPELGGATSVCPGLLSDALGGGTTIYDLTICPHVAGKTTGTAIASINGFAGHDHGSWPVNYGDQNSTYIVTHSDLTQSYITLPDYAVQTWTQFKFPGADEINVLYHDVKTTTTPTQIAVHAPFPQNGEQLSQFNTPGNLNYGYYGFAYDEGTTSYPGTGGCGNLNANRKVLEQQNSGSDYNGQTATHNMVWTVLVPSGAPNIWVNCDNPVVAVQSVTAGSTTIFNATGHGLSNGQGVTISGTTGPVTAGTYSSGITASGTGTCILSAFTGGGSGATATVPVASGVIAGGAALTITAGGSGYSYGYNFPATATAANGTATCSGTAVVVMSTSDWTLVRTPNHFALTLPATVIDANHFSLGFDSSAFGGSFNGTVKAVYTGGLGHIDRVSMCADSGSTGACGAGSQTGLEVIEVMKVTTAPDTALTTSAVNPDANWTGVQIVDAKATKDSVAIFARHNTTYATITDFVTTHPHSAQYTITGLAPASYPVTVNGTPVAGSPFTVTGGVTGGNTLKFESTSGTVHLNGGTPTCSITTSSLPGGTIGTPYSQTIATANCTPQPPTSNWTVASGTLCPGLSLSSTTGVISGTPTGSPTTCTFQIQVIDSVPNTAVSGSLSITMSSGGGGSHPSVVMSGKTSVSGKTVIH